MRKVCSCTAALLLCSAIFAQGAAADTIRITAGSAVVTGTGGSVSTPIHLEGERGFTLDSLATGLPSELFCADQCVPGATVPLNVGWGGFDLHSVVTLDGITYEGVGTAGVQTDATARFVASATLPPFSGETSTVVVPFLFSGTFTGGLSNVDLVGAGTVTSTFRRITGVGEFDFYVQEQSIFRFDAAASPVPEPGTLLLVGGGMLWGLRNRMRRR